MSNWFGNLQLAYKYVVVFLLLLFLTILAGGIKLLWNRRKLKQAKQKELEAGPKEDTVELNQREKDEGDLFGIRAIEAGFYAGVAQSRPTSRAGSVMGHQSASTSTLVGGNNPSSPLMKGQSANNSVLSLNLGDNGAQRRASPPSSKLRPSEAEMNGRRTHNGAVDMSLQVPASPGLPRGASPPTFGGVDSDSEGFTTPRSMSPRSADFNVNQYAPAPTIPMPDALRVSYYPGDDPKPQSQTASFNNSPSQSPARAPRGPPTGKLPSIPTSAMRKESRTPSPEQGPPSVRVYQPNTEPAQSSSAPHLLPRTYEPTHQRDGSDASSIYSGGNRLSTYQQFQAYQKETDRSASAASSETYNLAPSSTDGSSRTSVVVSSDKGPDPSKSGSLLLPALMQNGQTDSKDSRLSEFYEAYYRNSQVGPPQPVEIKRPIDRHSAIVEVDSPMPSPLLPKSQQPGSAY